MAEKDLTAYVSSVSIKQQQAEALGQSLAIGVEKDPDSHAKSIAMAMKTGVAPQMAVDFPQEIGKQAKMLDFSIDNMIDRNPRVSRFLASNTDNSAVAHDDTYSLNAMEYLLRPVDYARSAVAGAVKTVGADIRGRGLVEDISARNGVDAWDRLFGAAKLIAQPQKTIFNISTATAKIDAKQIGGDIQKLGDKIAPPKERQAFDTEVAEAVGQIATQIATSLTTGGSSLFYQGADAMDKKVAKDDASQTRKDLAVLGGASITAITEKFGLDKILNRVPPEVKNRTLRFITDKAAVFGIEFAQELTENIAQDITRKILTNENAPIGEGVLREGTVAGTAAAVVRTALGIKSFRQSQDQQQFIEAIGDTSKSSKLRERSPEKYNELLDILTENGPVQQVFIPQEQFKQYYQSVGKDPQQVANELGISNYAEAELSGGDLVIPMKSFVSQIAPSDDLQGLMQDVRLAQGFDTGRESQEKMANLEADIAALRAQFETDDLNRGVETTAMQEIKADIEGQLVQLGMTAKAANDYATVAAAGFRGISANAYKDLSPEEQEAQIKKVFDSTQFKVSMPMASVLKDKVVDIQLDPLLDAIRNRSTFDDKKINGPSMLEYLVKRKIKISDALGELTARDIDVGKTPSKRLIAGKGEQGIGLEEAALIAYDRGFIPEQNERVFLDAIDEELRGDGVYSREMGDVTQQDYLNKVDELWNYLDRHNIDVSELSNDEVRARLDEIAAAPEVAPDFYQPAAKTVAELVAKFEKDGLIIDAYEKSNVIHLSRIVVPLEERGQGKGTEFMQELARYADMSGQKIALSPSKDFGATSLARLKRFYKQFGFIENKGKKKDFAISETMYRNPEKTLFQTIDNTNTPEFLNWSKGYNVVKIKDIPEFTAGEGVVVEAIHGTTSDFDTFDLKKSNPESDLGSGFYFTNNIEDVGINYAGLGPDLTIKIERTAERIASETDREYNDPEVVAEARAEFMQNQGFSMPVYVRFDNPVVIGGSNPTFLDINQEYDEDAEEYVGEPTGKLIDFFDAMRISVDDYTDIDVDNIISDIYEISFDNGGLTALELIKKLKESEASGYAMDEDGYMAINNFIRDAFAEAGYDGFIDTTVSEKFKTMKGMDADTVHFIALDPTQVKSRVGNTGAYDPNNPNILYQVAEDNLDTKRGYVKFGAGKNKTVEIALLENRDMSTFVHELGHVWLELLGDVAQDPSSSVVTKNDYATVLKFLNVTDRSQIGTAQHEMWARANEAYLREGKAPSAELRSVFQKFKAWLTRIYKTIQQLDIELNDEVREVFDRIYATEQEIANEREAGDISPLFTTADAANMTDAEFEAYSTAVKDEIETAKEKLQQKLMNEFARTQKAWWKEQRTLMREEVAAEVNEMPVYVAFDRLALSTLKGEESIKISYLDLIAKYGKPFVNNLPRPYIYAKKGGIDADSAAEILGFNTGDELVQAIAQMKPKKEYIEAETDQRMKEKYGDIQTDGSLTDEARLAMHNDSRASVLAVELKAIKRKQREALPFVKAERAKATAAKKMALDATNVPPLAAFRAMAKGIIGSKRIMDITPYDYLLAERKNNKAAFKAMAQGNYQEAANYKQKELINHFMYLEAVTARQNIDKAREYLASFDKKSTREKVGKAGQEYLDQIDTLLEGFELKRIPLTEIARRMKLTDFVAQREAEGEFVDIPQDLIDKAQTTNYKQASYDEFLALRDAIKNIEHLARFKDKLMVRQKAREWAEVKTELLTSIKDSREPTGALERLTKTSSSIKEKGASAWRKFDAAHLKVEQLVEWMDGGEINGPWARYFFDLADAAQVKEYDLHRLITTELRKLQENMPAKWQKTLYDKTSASLPAADNINKYELIGIALNAGNEGNYDRLKSGRVLQDGQQFPWTQEQIDAALTNLTKEDWQFVQGVWDTVNLLWPDISSLQERMTGLAPPKVEARPFQVTTKQGETLTIKGGYFPIVYDHRMSGAGKKQAEAQETVQDFLNKGHGRATTAKGHTIARVASYEAPLNLDWSDTLSYHLSNVIKDVSHREAILGLNKILGDKEISLELEARLGSEYTKLLKDWTKTLILDRADSLHQAQGLAKVFMKTRTNMAIVTMGFKATTILAQIAGVGPAMDFVSPRNFYKGMQSLITSPKQTYEFVTEKSGEMRNRMQTIDRDVKDGLMLLRGETGILSAIKRTAFYATGMMDMVVSMPTWMGAYKQSLADGMSEQDAIRAGDRAVRLSQGASGAKDMAAVQRNNELTRLLTMYYTPFSALYARLRDVGESTNSMKDLPRAAARLMALVIFPAIIGELLAGRGPDDDEDDIWWAARKVALYPMATIPVVRDLSGLTEKWMISLIGDGKMDFEPSYNISPVVGAIKKVISIPSKVIDLYNGDKPFDDVAWDLFETSGYVLGLPTAQPRITGEYLENLLSGDVSPENASDVLKGLLFRPEKQ